MSKRDKELHTDRYRVDRKLHCEREARKGEEAADGDFQRVPLPSGKVLASLAGMYVYVRQAALGDMPEKWSLMERSCAPDETTGR